MPSLIKFHLLAGIPAGIIYGGMIALVTFVEPQPREMSQTIPQAALMPSPGHFPRLASHAAASGV